MSKKYIGAEDVENGDYEFEDSDSDLDDTTFFEYSKGKVVTKNTASVTKVAGAGKNTQHTQSNQANTSSKATLQPTQAMKANVLKKIHLDDFGSGGGGSGGGGQSGGAAMNKKVINDLQDAVDRGAHRASNVKKLQGHDKSERATVESVLDPRTRLLLYKLVNSGLLSEINGCVSTGKEAHVYYAKRGTTSISWAGSEFEGVPSNPSHHQQKIEKSAPATVPTTTVLTTTTEAEAPSEKDDDTQSIAATTTTATAAGPMLGDAAIKVYNTSVLVFKDREKYVAGEYRFKSYCKSNPRKMVRTWAEKEARNLVRLHNGGLAVPQVILLRQHVLVMEFLGENGWPAPKLKDCKFDEPGFLTDVYIDLVTMMRRMYRHCRLVHGDLSEYNLLYHQGRVVMIDVSQSVEFDHPEAMSFLRRDIVNVTRFFRSHRCRQTMSLEQLLFITTADSEDLTTVDVNDKERMGDGRKVPKPTKVSTMHTTTEGDTQEVLAWVKRCTKETIVPVQSTDEHGITDGINEDTIKVAERKFMEAVQHQKQKDAEERAEEENAIKLANKASGLTAEEEGAAHDEESSSDDGEDGEEDEEEEDDTTTAAATGGPTLADMTKEERKEHQKRIKEEKREKRSEKVPKHVKRRACKMHKKK